MISKEEHWAKLIEDWQESQQSGAQWCREKGINSKTFYAWKNRLLKASKPSFQEISSDPIKASGICLKIGNISMDLSPDFDSSTLKRFLQILQGI